MIVITNNHTYSLPEFAVRIGVHEQTLRRWAKNGRLTPYNKTEGGHYQYTEEQALLYFKKNSKGKQTDSRI